MVSAYRFQPLAHLPNNASSWSNINPILNINPRCPCSLVNEKFTLLKPDFQEKKLLNSFFYVQGVLRLLRRPPAVLRKQEGGLLAMIAI